MCYLEAMQKSKQFDWQTYINKMKLDHSSALKSQSSLIHSQNNMETDSLPYTLLLFTYV